MSDGRAECTECGHSVLTVHVSGLLAVLDWPYATNGDYAVYASAAGGFRARYCPVGAELTVGEKRYRSHSCQPPAPDISEPLHEQQRDDWRAAAARFAANSRRQRTVRKPAATRVGMHRKSP